MSYILANGDELGVPGQASENANARQSVPPLCHPTQRTLGRPRRAKKIHNGFNGLVGSPSRTRTCDHSINSRMLYQLSYRGSGQAAGRDIAEICAMESANFASPCFRAAALAEAARRRHDRAMLDPSRCCELLTPAQMAEADRLTIAGGIAGIALMERAGAAVADEAMRLAPSGGRVAVVCGPGGNGGDGFVAGRLLAARGYRVRLALLGERAAMRGDAALAAARYQGAVANAEGFELADADLVVDAIFGAGLSRDLDGAARRCVEAINAVARAGKPVLSVDMPTGVDGGTGAVRGAAVEASTSITFFRLKPGHLLLPGRALCGRRRDR